MMFKKTEEADIPGIGPVLFARSKRARRLSISIRPFKGIRVAVPYSVSFKAAERFLFSKTDWLRKHRDKLEKFEKEQVKKHNNAEPVNRPEARKKIISRLEILAKLNGFKYNKVQIRNQRTRWGSCSSKNNLSLNIKMAGLPDDLIDYIILHELVHTKYKNHSRYFWNELAKFVTDPGSKRKKLREYSYLLL
ncbi:MAG: M48 family metallopeptidase [bacterium]|nr:M48 family metallopeptidase [bacterium]